VGEPLKINIMGQAGRKPAGSDACIIQVPDRWYVLVDGQPVLAARRAGAELRALSEQQAAQLGEILHHAEWTLTTDPAQVRTIGLAHDCRRCRDGVARALAALAAAPATELAVGQLWWAQP
jgi:hypothetical protein